MQDPDLIAIFVAPLEAAGIPYLVSGAVATAIYGEPRNTLDIDLAVFPAPSQIEIFPQLFPAADFYLPPTDIIAGVINQSPLDLALLATATATLRLEQEWQAALALAAS